MSMTGAKIAFSAIGAVGGVSSTITGGILANVPGLSGDTPVNLTLALVGGGIAGTAIAAWKVSRAWSQIESKLARVEERLTSLERQPPKL